MKALPRANRARLFKRIMIGRAFNPAAAMVQTACAAAGTASETDGSAIWNLSISAYARGLLDKGGRLSRVPAAGLFCLGVVVPRPQVGIEAATKF